jgi:hypothetical protein
MTENDGGDRKSISGFGVRVPDGALKMQVRAVIIK